MIDPGHEQLDLHHVDDLSLGHGSQRESLVSIRTPTDIALGAKRLESGHWEITIAAMDHLGVLSIIAGLLNSLRIDFIRGDALTISDHAPKPKIPRKILNVFEVSTATIEGQAGWQAVRQEMQDLIRLIVAGQAEQAHEEVIERVSKVMASTPNTYQPLMPIDITVDNERSKDLTFLHVSSVLTPGFLFAFTNALAMLEIDIHYARIRTEGTKVEDTFWIRDAHGHKITSADKLQQIRAASVLIKQFAYLLPISANPHQALRQFKDLIKYMFRTGGRQSIDHLHSTEVMVTLAKLMGVSRHLWEDFLRMQHDNLFPLVSDPSRLEYHRNREELQRSLQSELTFGRDEEERIAQFNAFKDREIFRTDLRHITGRIDNLAFTREISNIAEVVVAQAVAICHEQFEARFGGLQLEDGSPCRWSVLAFGKCGGREMGFASDIELMFVYEGAGQTQGHQRISNQEYFVELVCLFLKVFKAPKEGIFEIDLRLRPYGKDGLLASTLDAFRKYYHPDGPARQFERMALTKLRPITGDPAFGKKLMSIRDDFVFADQSMDFENILHLRQRQAKELVPSGTVNAKYSPGGLVDLEYYVQAHQIEQGRFHAGLRVTNMLEALNELEIQNLIDARLAHLIRDSYQLIRRLIDALRVVRGNAKDLSIPSTSSRAYTYLARRLGYDNNRHLQRDLYCAMALGRTLWQKKRQGQDWTTLIEHTLLVCTDTHTRMRLPDIDVPHALAWLHGGDFYMRKSESRRKRPVGAEGMKGYHAQKAALGHWCTQRHIPLYAVRGNHDVTDPWGFFQCFKDISGQLEEITTHLWVAGLGWSGERFYQLPQEAELKTICEHLAEQLSNRLRQESCLIILSHYPAVTELCTGFHCINDFLTRWKPIVFIQGHIHEAFKQQTLLSWQDGSQTLVINPGPEGGILTVQPEAGTANFTAF